MKSHIIKDNERNTSDMRPGIYDGLWSGYSVNIEDKWKFTTKIGIRGINIPCKVHIDVSGEITCSC